MNGEEYVVSAWLKTAKSGVEYLSLAIEPKRGAGARARRDESPRDPAQVEATIDDEIPW